MAPRQIDFALSLINSENVEDHLMGIRKLKNLVIGNKTNKNLLLKLDSVTMLVHILNNPEVSLESKEQIIVVLGSLAHGNQQYVDKLFQINAIQYIIQFLSSAQIRIIESSARALRTLFLNNKTTRPLSRKECDLILKTLNIASDTHSLSNDAELNPDQVEVSLIKLRTAETAAGIVSHIVPSLKAVYENELKHVLKIVTQYLKSTFSFYPKLQEATLDALASLFKEWPSSCAQLSQFYLGDSVNSIQAIVDLTRSKRSSMRLLACTCLTNIARSPNSLQGQKQQELGLYVLPNLIKLFQDTSNFENIAGYGNATIQEKAPLVFAHLVGENEALQKWAKDADAINKLCEIIEVTKEADIAAEQPVIPANPDQLDAKKLFPKPRIIHSSIERRREAAFLAIASVCSLREECRKQVIDVKLLPAIVQGLSHTNVGIRAAACNCTRSLSRSVKNLRTALVDAGVAIPLMKLLADENNQVKITASATLCNIVLDFSPMKKIVLENGGVEMLVSLIKSPETDLRLNTVWALKNLLYQADSDIKIRVMSLLGWDELEKLLNDGQPSIKEQALNLLRNLACGKEKDIQQVFDGFGASKLLRILNDVLDEKSASDEIVLQALYTVVNIVTGTDEHKNLIVSEEKIIKRIGGYLKHPKSSLRIAAVWCIINLTWKEDKGTTTRIQKLVDMGIEAQLQSIQEDEDADVRDRVKTALSHFQVGGDVQAGGGSSNSSMSWSSSGIVPILRGSLDARPPTNSSNALGQVATARGGPVVPTPRRRMNVDMEDESTSGLNEDALLQFGSSFGSQRNNELEPDDDDDEEN